MTTAQNFSDAWFAARGWRVTARRPRRIFADLVGEFLPAMGRLIDAGVTRLITITGIDLGGADIELLYHLDHEGTVITLRCRVPKGALWQPSLVPRIPGIALFEREIHDMFGVRFRGHPDLSPLLLPDDWPPGVYPMRVEWTPAALRQRLDAYDREQSSADA
jgi:NADH:ubiquinone oxidoreductase subunit C